MVNLVNLRIIENQKVYKKEGAILMADTTYAVKVSEEVRERLQNLIEESGSSSKDFFSDMVSQFELMNVKNQTPMLSADIDEIVKLTSRINNIFINVGERVSGLQETYRQNMEHETKEKESLISLLQQQVESLKIDMAQTEIQVSELIADNDALRNDKAEAEKLFASEVNQLREVNLKNNELISGYSEKINTLTGLVNEYKGYSDENKLIKEEITEAKKTADKLLHENERLGALLAEKENQIQTVLADNDASLNNLQQKQIQEMEYQRNKLELERDRMLLEQREQYNKELEEIREMYQNKINQLLQIGGKKS